MPRLPIPVLAWLLAVALVLAGSPATGRAQDATPEPEGGVLAETLAVGPLAEVPGQMLLQLRVTLAPGAVVPSHIHPGNLVFSVESGEITYTAIEGSVPVAWAEAGAPVAEMTLNPGDVAVLETGDWLFEQHGTIHEVRNSGDTPAVLLISALVDEDEPFLQPVESGANPLPRKGVGSRGQVPAVGRHLQTGSTTYATEVTVMTEAVLPIEGVHHIRLTVTDVGRACRFYTNLLGFAVATEFPPPEGVLLRNGNTLLGLRPASALGGGNDDRFAERRVGLDHLSFSTGHRELLASAAAALDKHRIPHGEIKELPDLGIAVLAFRDPDNIQLELTAPLG